MVAVPRPIDETLRDLLDERRPIRESFMQGRNEPARDRIRRGEDPLRLAVAPLVTSKPVVAPEQPGHAGYGLYLASEVAVRNGGTFLMASGDHSLSLFLKGGRRGAQIVRHRPWRGTVVAIILSMDNVVSIRDVYATLPQPAGYEDEDFFA